MSDIFEVIKNRRSVRAYKDEQIEDEQIEQILEAAIMAPTARGEAPWHFTVVQNKETLADINDSVLKILSNSGDEFLEAIAESGVNVMHNAPTVVFVSAKSIQGAGDHRPRGSNRLHITYLEMALRSAGMPASRPAMWLGR